MFKFRLTALEKRWIAYDVGNSAFVLLLSTIIPIYFNYLSDSAGLPEADYLSYWSYATSVSTIIVAFLGPVLGTMADYRGNRKKFFVLSALAGAIGLACFAMPNSWMAFLGLYIVAKICYSLSLVFYDSMLGDVTTHENMDAVSTIGYAVGYLGSIIPFVISLVFVLLYDKFGISYRTAMMIAFILNALWWIGFTIPLYRSYRQKSWIEPERHVVHESFARLKETFSSIKQHRKIFLYLLAFFFYIDGVYTVIDMATAYGTSLGLDTAGLLLALLVTQIVAFPASMLFAGLSRKQDAVKLIKICIIAYFCIGAFAIFLEQLWQFWVLAVAVGCFQGGIQALSRSYFAKIVPHEKAGEYFGIYDICGKGASFIGLLIVGFVTQLTGRQSLDVACITLLFVIGYILFAKAAALPNDDGKNVIDSID